MANDYLQFSFIIPKLTDAEKAWTTAYLADKRDEDGEAEDGWYTFPVIDQDGDLWFFAQEYGDVEQCAEVVQDFLQIHRPDDRVSFEWALTCSRPQLDAFGGGACVVTATEQHFFSTDQWLITKERELDAEVKEVQRAREMYEADEAEARRYERRRRH